MHSHLEYCVQFWPPGCNAITGVEGRETKKVYWVKQTLRRDLKNPGFFSLEKRLRGAKIRVVGAVVH